MSGAGEIGKAPGRPWDGDKILGPLRLECRLEGEVDQPIEEKVEKMEPRKEDLGGESCWADVVVAVVVVVVVGVVVVVAGCDEEGSKDISCGISSTSRGVSTVRGVSAQLQLGCG